jgi:hypothetical protein
LIPMVTCTWRIPITTLYDQSPQQVFVMVTHQTRNTNSLRNSYFLMLLLGAVSTSAGIVGAHGSTDGSLLNAQFSYPTAIAVDSTQNVFIGDTNGVRKLYLLSGIF